MTRWHWVRHAPTHQKNFVGWRDCAADLSDTAQIARLRNALPETALLVSSDLSRSIDTATALEDSSRIRLPHQPGLREIHFGLWDGLHFSQVSERDPDLSRAFWETPGTVRAPGGESWDEAALRVSTAVDALSNMYPNADIIAVAHFGAILTQVQRALGVSAYETLAHSIDNLSVTRIDWHRGSGQASAINHVY
ncbi:MAG: histidine phosphatase family protein [Roseobacter sp.]